MGVNPDGTPSPVAPGELIESAWGNAVVYELGFAATHAVVAGGAAVSLTAGQTAAVLATGSLVAVAYPRLMIVTFAEFVSVGGSGGSATVQLVVSGVNAVGIAELAPGGSVTGSWTGIWTAGTASAVDLNVVAGPGASTAQTFVDPNSNRLHVVGIPIHG